MNRRTYVNGLDACAAKLCAFVGGAVVSLLISRAPRHGAFVRHSFESLFPNTQTEVLSASDVWQIHVNLVTCVWAVRSAEIGAAPVMEHIYRLSPMGAEGGDLQQVIETAPIYI